VAINDLTKEETENSMITGITKLVIPLFISSLLLLSSCDNQIIYTDSVSIPGNQWTLELNPQFSADINDTINNCDIQFIIRNSSSYPFRNIYLFVTTTSPKGVSITDTLEYMLADEKGNWYGKGIGDIHELTVQYKSNIYFPNKGTYLFRVQHGMRVEDLNGIYDFGIRILKRDKK
jgi:gliding motility-associated lipoprotein GldH